MLSRGRRLWYGGAIEIKDCVEIPAETSDVFDRLEGAAERYPWIGELSLENL
jgi:hypothetical protein